jgi:hypothetical protein
MPIHDHEERRWRHLDSCQLKTILVCQVPVVRCPTHGTQNVQVPWAEKYSRYFERLAIDLMLECSVRGGLPDPADQLGRGRRDQAAGRGSGLGAEAQGHSSVVALWDGEYPDRADGEL